MLAHQQPSNWAANQIQVHQQQPKKAGGSSGTVQPLAIVIRNSLTFEQAILVNSRQWKLREPLGVDRCNFVWCYFDDPAPSLILSHEAQASWFY